VKAFIGIGANLGRRELAVLGSLRRIEEEGAATLTRCSSLYESDAVAMGPAPRFVNAVAQVRPLLSLVDLLKRLKTIEKRMGRRSGHNAPREIDLDVIAFGLELVDTPELTVPHPRFHERAFVLLPLQEIAPGFVCPRTGRSIDRMIERLTTRGSVMQISRRNLIPRATP
jgi:2-amino-4-hydroxy-6-hydroxymethyldihydropteridine diphosphokinase